MLRCSTMARNTEDLFKESNRYFDAILIDVLKRKGILDISITDFELNFVRNETANVQSKAQALNTMISSGLHPELALAKSGISNDPVSDLKMSEKWMTMIWGDPEQKAQEVKQAAQTGNLQTEEQASRGEAVIIEQDNNNGENSTGGDV